MLCKIHVSDNFLSILTLLETVCIFGTFRDEPENTVSPYNHYISGTYKYMNTQMCV